MGCDPPCHGLVPVDRVPCQYASATPDRPGQLLEGPSTCETLRCGAPHCSSTKQSLSRGLSNSSCCSLHEGTAEVPTQHGKRECTSNKKDGTYVEDPEDRPLPTLLKRQQQPLHTQRQPGSQLPENVVQHRREQLQQQPMKTANRPEASAEKESDTVVETGVKGKWEGAADERPCRAVGRAKVSNSTNMPADRRWRFNELWACLSHGFPPPPALGPIIRVSDKDRDDPLSVTSSWCTSECESELPCQTILLPHASNCTTPPVGKRVQQCIARQIETFSKDGWLPTSQMETLEESTGQTCMPDEHDQLSRKEQDLYKAFAPRMENGGAYEGISVANERATLMTRRIPETSRFDAFDARRERVPETPPADVDFNRGKSVLREDRLFLTNDQQICRALSVGAAPLKLQQLRQWDSHIRQKYNADMSLRERYLHQLNAVAGHRQAPGRSFQNASLPRAQPHLKNAELKPPAHRPLAPELQAKSSPTTGEASIPSAQGKAEAFSPRPAKPPNKHALPVQKSARSSSVSVINKKSRFTRAFLGAMLPRSSSRTRQ
ncbi:LOW QUALITY PROTEIN: uncharacterized protein EMH_0040930 [Eimeria mitis]|uniref:Uncharacterized protein n=1 Tax=Eimeria mitis TaxID=44415 RepID=U6JSM0_9EIME|nr:LOW QUALITY PROTEIN: uncharacterized protein EMH_0040930 [Eimeria mitis]CDJ28450.1 hypothetical protein, conserved [Eimeria mitis]